MTDLDLLVVLRTRMNSSVRVAGTKLGVELPVDGSVVELVWPKRME